MLVLGLSGGLDQLREQREHLFRPGICHDSAAVLVENGRVVAAFEEERLVRIKHTSKGAVRAVAKCLAEVGAHLNDLDRVVYYGTEAGCDRWMRNLFYGSRDAEPVATYRQLIHQMFEAGLGQDIEDQKLRFVHHHLAHATAAFAHSGQSEGMVVTLDGAGDGLSGSVSRWSASGHDVLATFPEASSLGNLYDRVIQMLGFTFTEEYKVMGLAPYGNGRRFKDAFTRLYALNDNGHYAIDWQAIEDLYEMAPVRKRGQPILQVHMDLAAGLQGALETIVLHVLEHFREATGMSSLCLAGGVAHNSTLNGRILRSGLFDQVFVHPAAGDAGCAVGAALAPFAAEAGASPTFGATPIEHVFWGTDIGDASAIEASLARWSAILAFERVHDVARHCARLIANGEVIGWVQGRAEFGPRALGHRSILADPRPASNKEAINAMVKKREGFRPFAPAVLAERAGEFFAMQGDGTALRFMAFTCDVLPEARSALGATTHVDGSARVQTVFRKTDPLFWSLIDEFGRISGLPVLLNTSLNNDAEPIVDSVDDAVICFLTTGLQRLVVGDFIVDRRVSPELTLGALAPSLSPHSKLIETDSVGAGGVQEARFSIGSFADRKEQSISAHAHALLRRADGHRSTAELLAGIDSDLQASLLQELWSLWDRRVIRVGPGAAP